MFPHSLTSQPGLTPSGYIRIWWISSSYARPVSLGNLSWCDTLEEARDLVYLREYQQGLPAWFSTHLDS